MVGAEMGRAAVVCAVLAMAASASEIGAQVTPQGAPEIPALHHAHLNSVDPDAAIDWYHRLWPTGRRGRVAGHPAFIARMSLLFNAVDAPPPGAWNDELRRSDPQSPFWHIGGFTDTSDKLPALEAEGFELIPLFIGTDGPLVARSGLTPYEGIVTEQSRSFAPEAEPRPGGFGYLKGPDGALVELTGSPRTQDAFNHVHLFHEQPRCAANWYAETLGFQLPPLRDESGQTVPREQYDGCDEGERGSPGWPSLEQVGTVRAPNARVIFANGSISIYPRQCTVERCGAELPLVPTRGQVLDHIAFRVGSLRTWIAYLRDLDVTFEGPYAFGNGRGILLAGPDGMGIELIER